MLTLKHIHFIVLFCFYFYLCFTWLKVHLHTKALLCRALICVVSYVVCFLNVIALLDSLRVGGPLCSSVPTPCSEKQDFEVEWLMVIAKVNNKYSQYQLFLLNYSFRLFIFIVFLFIIIVFKLFDRLFSLDK